MNRKDKNTVLVRKKKDLSANAPDSLSDQIVRFDNSNKPIQKRETDIALKGLKPMQTYFKQINDLQLIKNDLEDNKKIHGMILEMDKADLQEFMLFLDKENTSFGEYINNNAYLLYQLKNVRYQKDFIFIDLLNQKGYLLKSIRKLYASLKELVRLAL